MAELEKMKRTEMSAAEPQNAVGNPNQAAQPQNAIGSPSASDKSPNLMQQHQQQRQQKLSAEYAQDAQRMHAATQRTNATANPDQAAALQSAQQELAAKQQALSSMQTTPAAGQAQAAVSRQYQAAQPQNAIGSLSASDKSPNLMQPQNAIGSPSASDKSPNLMQQHQQQRQQKLSAEYAQDAQRMHAATAQNAQRTNAAVNPDQASALQSAQQELAAKQQALSSMQTTPAAGQAQAVLEGQYQAAQPQNAIGGLSASDKSPNLMQPQRALTPPVMEFAPDTPSPNRATSEELYGPRSLSQSQSISYSETSGGGKPLERVDTWEMERNLKEANEAAKKQQTAAIDQATRANAEQLRIAEREAQAQYDEQRRQTSLDERQAMDNSALYAAARGDRGGVGRAQYNAIQANAARNRASIGQAQTKLSTDVTRQIADLRRQGEFKKADALLTLSQQYLSQLNDLKRWATETNLTVDQANNALAQWEKSYAIDLAGVTGEYNGEQTLDAKKIGADIAYQQGSLDLDRAIHEHDKEQDAIKNAYNDRSLDAEIAHNEATLALDQAIHEHDKEQDAIKNAYNDRSLDAEIAHNQASLDLDRAIYEHDKEQDAIKNAYNDKALDAEIARNQASLDLDWAIHEYNKGQDYLNRSQDQRELDASNGWTLLKAGQMPNATQLAAMGRTAAQAQQYINDAKALQAATDDASAAGDVFKVANLGWKSLDAGIMPSAAQLAAMEMDQADAQARIDRILEKGSPVVVEDEQKPGSPATTTAPQTPKEPMRDSFGVHDPLTGQFINRADTRIRNVRVDGNGNTVYTLNDGRILYDYTSQAPATLTKKTQKMITKTATK